MLAIVSAVSSALDIFVLAVYWRVILRDYGDPDLVFRFALALSFTSILTAYLSRRASKNTSFMTRVALTAAFAATGYFVVSLHYLQLGDLIALIRSSQPIP
jgi:hypothetical protein